MPSILTGTLIILSAIIMTVVKRKIRIHRRIKANDRIIKEIVEKIERYEKQKNQNR